METQTMGVIKQASIETLKRLPDECTVDDIMYEINFGVRIIVTFDDSLYIIQGKMVKK